MKEFDERTYGDRIAAIYDELYPDYEEATVDLLEELAGDGRALELGIGTGRLALPLSRRGVDVAGIDSSKRMLGRLRAKPGGDELQLVQGSFRQIDIDGRFQLIYVLFNTFYALLTQDAQVDCFRSVADHLQDDGLFLVEAFVPDLARFDRQQTVRAVDLTTDRVNMEVSRHDPLSQQVINQHLIISEEGIRLYPVKLRYAWPSEFDLMARIAGLRLKERWGSWQKAAFTAGSDKHISLYGHRQSNG